jgi:hypothetical protein
MEIKLRELIEIYGLENVLEWIGEEKDSDVEDEKDKTTRNLAIDILLLPEAVEKVRLLKVKGKSLKNITFNEWLNWARKVKKNNREKSMKL